MGTVAHRASLNKKWGGGVARVAIVPLPHPMIIIIIIDHPITSECPYRSPKSHDDDDDDDDECCVVLATAHRIGASHEQWVRHRIGASRVKSLRAA